MNAWKRKFKENPPDEEVCLGERPVACGCDPKLSRPVLLPPRGLEVNACLGCGTVTCSLCRGDDGRYTGNASYAYFSQPLPPEVVAWLGSWPRARITWLNSLWPMAKEWVRRDYLYYPAATRCQDVAACERLEAKLAGTQATKSMAARLRELDYPRKPPPADLPEALCDFAHVWEALQLGVDADLSKLIFLAQLRNQASPIAAELLQRRADAFDIMVKALRSDDLVWRSAGYAMARDARPFDPRLPAVLINVLEGLSLAPLLDVPGRVTSWSRCEAVLVLIAELGLKTPEICVALKQLQMKLIRKDLHLVDAIRTVLGILKGEPTPSLAARRTGGYLP